MAVTVGMPLGMQYIYTSLACGSFASAMLPHPCAAGASLVEVHTSDPSRAENARERKKGVYVHTALKLPDGMLLDAEGRRSFDDLCCDFGLDPGLTVARAAAATAEPDESAEAQAIRRIADLCGWRDGAPLAAEVETATDNWSAAYEDFVAVGGMSGEPAEMLARWEARLLERTSRSAAAAEVAAAGGWACVGEDVAAVAIPCGDGWAYGEEADMAAALAAARADGSAPRSLGDVASEAALCFDPSDEVAVPNQAVDAALAEYRDRRAARRFVR